MPTRVKTSRLRVLYEDGRPIDRVCAVSLGTEDGPIDLSMDVKTAVKLWVQLGRFLDDIRLLNERPD